MTLLRLDKDLRYEIIKPLREGMIDRGEVDYKALQTRVQSIHEEAKICVEKLGNDFYNREKAVVMEEVGP